MKLKKLFVLLLPVFAAVGFIVLSAGKNAGKTTDSTSTASHPLTAAGLTLPAGFSAVVLAENLGGPRHLAVTPEGDIYVKQENTSGGKGVAVYHDDGDKATLKTSFGNYGGTGIAIKNGYLYATSNSDIYRYKLNDKNEIIDPTKPETVVSGLTNKRMHNSKSIALDNDGNIYV
ncbi:MAG: sorbosone dehydrogenase, partial [Mucilaginibacter sp.]